MTPEELAKAYLELDAEQRAYFQGYVAAAQLAQPQPKRGPGRPAGSRTRNRKPKPEPLLEAQA